MEKFTKSYLLENRMIEDTPTKGSRFLAFLSVDKGGFDHKAIMHFDGNEIGLVRPPEVFTIYPDFGSIPIKPELAERLRLKDGGIVAVFTNLKRTELQIESFEEKDFRSKTLLDRLSKVQLKGLDRFFDSKQRESLANSWIANLKKKNGFKQ
ncbi:MAG: hypothetical protein KGH53_01675 [Candidatus Micrarchaeota archaeon]|nr:hypothetical protein [Candidatus Micrarchaeota archaeon]